MQPTSINHREKFPPALLDVPLGSGTVGTEYDRTLSLGFEGDGPVSTRQIVPLTNTAARALASPAGPAIEGLARAAAATGAEQLQSITFVPDEHALEALHVLRSHEQLPTLSIYAQRDGMAVAARRFVERTTTGLLEDEASTLASNWFGAVTIMPDVSRDLLASVGAYRLQPGDVAFDTNARSREERMRDGWDTLLHESHHSRTPRLRPLGHHGRLGGSTRVGRGAT